MEKALAYTTEEGGRQILWPAVSEDVDPEELRGGFVVRDQVVEPSDFVISERGVYAQNKLWVGHVCFLSFPFFFLHQDLLAERKIRLGRPGR